MTGLWIAILFLFWYGFSLYLSETFDKKTRIPKQWLFFISFVFSPLAGFLTVLWGKKTN